MNSADFGDLLNFPLSQPEDHSIGEIPHCGMIKQNIPSQETSAILAEKKSNSFTDYANIMIIWEMLKVM